MFEKEKVCWKKCFPIFFQTMNLTCWAKATASSSTLQNKKNGQKRQIGLKANPCRRELLGSFDRFWLKSPHTSNFQLLPVCVLPIIRKGGNFLIKTHLLLRCWYVLCGSGKTCRITSKSECIKIRIEHNMLLDFVAKMN